MRHQSRPTLVELVCTVMQSPNENYYYLTWFRKPFGRHVFSFLYFVVVALLMCVCSHQFSGDFYKSFAAHKKTHCKGRQKKYIPSLTCVFPFSSSPYTRTRTAPERRFVYFIINTNIANTTRSPYVSPISIIYTGVKRRSIE